MSTKTIALGSSVYDQLARQKRSSESFTKTIARLIEQNQTSLTCGSAVAEAAAIWHETSDEEAATFEKVIHEGRTTTQWDARSFE